MTTLSLKDVHVYLLSALLLPLTAPLAVVRSHTNIRLASWNLLAPDFANPRKYPQCDPEHLKWSYRQSLVVPQIQNLQADVVCLQEVSVRHWPDFLQALQPDYHGVLQNVTGGHNVASAILIHKDAPLQVESVESRSRVLMVVLKPKGDDVQQQPNLYLCSVHLEAGWRSNSELQRYFQLKSLFKRLRNQCHLHNTQLEDIPLVLAGDFNILRASDLHHSLTEGRLKHPEKFRTKAPIEIVPLSDSYLLESSERNGLATTTTTVIQTKESLQHYQSPSSPSRENRQALVRTFARGFVLDYIWTSRHVTVKETYLLDPKAVNKQAEQWPTVDQPSDHLPIAVDLGWG